MGIQAIAIADIDGTNGPCKIPIATRVSINPIEPPSETAIGVMAKKAADKSVVTSKTLLPPYHCAAIPPNIWVKTVPKYNDFF